MKGAIHQIIGKRSKEVIVSENDREPNTQIFLVFDDDTYFEIYGYGRMAGAGGVDRGNGDVALNYAKKAGGVIEHFKE